MITSRTDYLLNRPPDEFQIDGGILPCRGADNVFRGEDLCYLTELLDMFLQIYSGLEQANPIQYTQPAVSSFALYPRAEDWANIARRVRTLNLYVFVEEKPSGALTYDEFISFRNLSPDNRYRKTQWASDPNNFKRGAPIVRSHLAAIYEDVADLIFRPFYVSGFLGVLDNKTQTNSRLISGEYRSTTSFYNEDTHEYEYEDHESSYRASGTYSVNIHEQLKEYIGENIVVILEFHVSIFDKTSSTTIEHMPDENGDPYREVEHVIHSIIADQCYLVHPFDCTISNGKVELSFGELRGVVASLVAKAKSVLSMTGDGGYEVSIQDCPYAIVELGDKLRYQS